MFFPGSVGDEYFVSAVSGSDEENVPGSESSPWRTLHHAIEQLRKIRPNNPGPEDGATLTIMGGVYHLPDTINMGRREEYLAIRNYKEDSVTSMNLQLYMI